ncbi:MAG TPA: hypothetical protein VMB78_06080, partial [Dissulfurispiraceae bacterium]|nr:hypothetical protein [Dissulfurispiraceae bacterium]HTZ17992.1 hypothetical protein [Dissulfurispiraceae bacterium]
MRSIRIISAIMFALCITITCACAEDQAPVAPAAGAAAAAPATPPAPDVTGSVTFTGLNRYIFRGAELSNKSVVL